MTPSKSGSAPESSSQLKVDPYREVQHDSVIWRAPRMMSVFDLLPTGGSG